MAKKVLPIIGGRGYRGKSLSGKQCFELWVDRGSAKKAALALYNEFGIYNKKKDKPYTMEAIHRSAKFYILENQEEARKIWEAKYGELETNVWYDYLLRSTSFLMNSGKDRYKRWKEDNPEILAYAEENNIPLLY